MMENNFEKLREQLALQEWPGVFLFKFIVPNEPEAIAKASALFGESSDINMRPSRNGKFMSLSVKELMLDVDSIIERYQKAIQIKGLIAL